MRLLTDDDVNSRDVTEVAQGLKRVQIVYMRQFETETTGEIEVDCSTDDFCAKKGMSRDQVTASVHCVYDEHYGVS